MDYTIIDRFKIMDCNVAPNGLEITENMLTNALANRVFSNKPIIFNDNQNFKDYRNIGDVENYQTENCIGHITENVWQENDKNIYATVFIQSEFANRTGFDNWMIDIESNYTDMFIYCSCELFNK